MSSQFFGLYVSQSGLNAFQAAINTTANNIANVQTKGYSRQEVVLKASSSLRAFQKYGSVSTGVTPEEVAQLRDKYYDMKYWGNQSSYGYYDTKIYYQTQIEDYYTDSAATEGFTTIFNSLFNSLDSIKSNPSDTSIRAQFVNESEKLARYFNTTSTQLKDLQVGINDEIKAQVDEINSIASKIATLNKQINTLEVNASNANELRDERALLVDKLSEIVAIEVQEDIVEDPKFPDFETGLTLYNIKINGQSLVSTGEFNKLEVVTRKNCDNQMDAEGLYDIQWAGTGVRLNVFGNNQTGRLRALFEMRDGNDSMNLRGTVVSKANDPTDDPDFKSDNKHIVLQGLNNTRIEDLNMPAVGDVTIRGVDYSYESFDVETYVDEETGDIMVGAVRFNLEHPLTEEKLGEAIGSKANVGNTVDVKGIPYYQNEMNKFLRSFSKAFNDIEHNAEDLHGDLGESFFVANHPITGEELKFGDKLYDLDKDGKVIGDKKIFNSNEDTYYMMTAASIWVNTSVHDDLKKFGAAVYKADEQGVDDSTIIDQFMLLQKDKVIYRSGGAATFLESIYSDVTVDTRESTMFQEYYTNIQKAIDKQRKSVSGVDEDEEAQNLVKFQNAYNLSSKVISVLAEMYDQLILNTGV